MAEFGQQTDEKLLKLKGKKRRLK